MALFGKKEVSFSHEIIREGEDSIMRINYTNTTRVPSIEDDTFCMSLTIEKLTEVESVNKIVFYQKRDIEYDAPQVMMLLEIARIYKHLVKQKNIFNFQNISSPSYSRQDTRRYTEIQTLVFRLLKGDPVGAYVELRRVMRREKLQLQKAGDPADASTVQRIVQVLEYVIGLLEKTKIITLAKPYLSGYRVGQRDIYREIFQPIIKPDFMFTKLMASFPSDGEEMDSYLLDDDIEVTIFRFDNSVQYLYHVIPPEFKLNEDQYEILDMARKIMAEHKPERSEFVDPERMRQVFYNVSLDLIEELVEYKKYDISNKEQQLLAKILVRYTVGFGLIEVLLTDEKIQDISVNSPMGNIPIYIVHQDFDDCYTNIIPTSTEAESWATKLRLISGRPLDEANPILDTELELPQASVRVSSITAPLDPTGLAYSFRRHRDRPWTLPLFMKFKTISPMAAGLISFLVDGNRTMMICGTRSSGKSSILSSVLVEIMRRYRIITVEDTLELPTGALRKLGYNIQSMKVASALSLENSAVNAEFGIRSTLRLGDSALIVGEVRSGEAKALYEAMRVGAAANVVAGTVHADSPFGLYDRIVNDIGVPKTSFKATDIIMIVNPIRSADGLHKLRRMLQIAEVRKHWENDPNTEGGFVDLMRYDARKDLLEPSKDLLNGDSETLKEIASKIKEFAGNWDAIWENIQMRGALKQMQLNYALKLNDMEMLEAPFSIQCNDMMHVLAGKITEEVGHPDPKRIIADWEDWIKRESVKRNVK